MNIDRRKYRALLKVHADAMSLTNRNPQFETHLAHLREAILDMMGSPQHSEHFSREPLRRALQGTNKRDQDSDFNTLIDVIKSSIAKYAKATGPKLEDIVGVCTECGKPSRHKGSKICFWCRSPVTEAKKVVAELKAQIQADRDAVAI